MQLPHRIPYNPQWRLILACAVFSGAGTVFMGYKAVHNTAGLVINHIITLGPTGASLFYGVIAALSAVFLLATLLLAMRRISHPKMLELDTEAIVLPHGWFQSRTTRIAYSDIQNLIEVEAAGQRLLHVMARGVRYTITASLLPDTGNYEMVKDFLATHAPR